MKREILNLNLNQKNEYNFLDLKISNRIHFHSNTNHIVCNSTRTWICHFIFQQNFASNKEGLSKNYIFAIFMFKWKYKFLRRRTHFLSIWVRALSWLGTKFPIVYPSFLSRNNFVPNLIKIMALGSNYTNLNWNAENGWNIIIYKDCCINFYIFSSIWALKRPQKKKKYRWRHHLF